MLAALRVAPDGQQFLDNQRADALPHGAYSSRIRVARTSRGRAPRAIAARRQRVGHQHLASRRRPETTSAGWPRNIGAAESRSSSGSAQGMLSISKMKPDSSNAGKNAAISAAWLADELVPGHASRSTVPAAAWRARNADDTTSSTGIEPRNGHVEDQHRRGHRQAPSPPSPAGNRESACRAGTPATPTGVAIRASIVPRSHSRATTSAVSSVPIKVMMMATEPGIRKFWLRSLGLNQYRGSVDDQAARSPRHSRSDRRNASCSSQLAPHALDVVRAPARRCSGRCRRP